MFGARFRIVHHGHAPLGAFWQGRHLGPTMLEPFGFGPDRPLLMGKIRWKRTCENSIAARVPLGLDVLRRIVDATGFPDLERNFAGQRNVNSSLDFIRLRVRRGTRFRIDQWNKRLATIRNDSRWSLFPPGDETI
jgi:hypothetical protein